MKMILGNVIQAFFICQFFSFTIYIQS